MSAGLTRTIGGSPRERGLLFGFGECNVSSWGNGMSVDVWLPTTYTVAHVKFIRKL